MGTRGGGDKVKLVDADKSEIIRTEIWTNIKSGGRRYGQI